MSSTTEHVDYAETATKSRGQLLADLKRARQRNASLVEIVDGHVSANKTLRAENTKLRRALRAVQQALKEAGITPEE